MRFARTEAWNGLTVGDPVRIAGLRGRRWRFRCHVTNVATSERWVEVAELDLPRGGGAVASRAGGSDVAPPVRRIRSFPEDRILPLRQRRRGRLDPPPGQGTLELHLSLDPASPGAPRARAARARATRGRRPAEAANGVEALRLELWAAQPEHAQGPTGPEQVEQVEGGRGDQPTR